MNYNNFIGIGTKRLSRVFESFIRKKNFTKG